MGIVPIHGPYARRYGAMFCNGQTSISITGWSKITVASNNGIIPCAALELSRQPLASAGHLMRFVSSSADEVRQFFRVRTTVKQTVSLAQQREVFRQRL